MAKPHKLMELIIAKGYKVSIVSEMLGYTYGNAYHWCNGRSEPHAKDTLGLAKILDVPVEQIVRIFGED